MHNDTPDLSEKRHSRVSDCRFVCLLVYALFSVLENEIKPSQLWETNHVVPFLCFGNVNNSIDNHDKIELRISPS